MTPSPPWAPDGRAETAPRGFVLLFVILLGALLSAGLVVALIGAEDSADVTAKTLQKKRAFYAADGMQRTVTELAQSYLAANPDPTQAELDAFFDSAMQTSITPPGYSLESFEVTSAEPVRANIPNGPFRDMTSRQIPFEVGVRIRNDKNQAAAEQYARLVLGQLAVFQFYVFADTFAEDHPGPAMTWDGRAHSNYGWCLGGGNLTANWVTAAGPIMLNQDSRCKYTGGGTNFKINRTDGGGTKSLKASADNGCTNCDGSGQDWKQYAVDRFNEQLLDESHGVNKLKLPISGEPNTQAGWAANVQNCNASSVADCTYPNARDVSVDGSEANSRFIVDPYLPSIDTIDIRDQKFAYKSDIRIIDGAWYIKEAGVSWPGTPIWSDHPGSYLVEEREGFEGDLAVGHRDLQAAWGTNVNDVPDRFSYYGTHQTAANLTMTHDPADPVAVVSYGPLKRRDHGGGDVYWYPGHLVGRDNSGSFDAREISGSVCPSDVTDRSIDCTTSDGHGCIAEATMTGGGSECGTSGTPVPADHSAALLNGTRSGFRDGHIERASLHDGSGSGNGQSRLEANRSRILPMNIDVAALQAALKDCTAGELGSYFPTTCDGSGDRTFNGIVYVGSTWPGQMEGLGDTAATQGHPEEWPHQGMPVIPLPSTGVRADDLVAPLRDSNQPDIVATAHNGTTNGTPQNQALPYNLCSSTYDASTNVEGRSGWCYNGSGNAGNCVAAPTDTNAFKVPRCEDYTDYDALASSMAARSDLDATIEARVNAVRVINARYVNPSADRTVADGNIVVEADVLPEGLTIATNIPIYVLGKVNVDTKPEILDETDSGYHFVPTLFAGDRISVFTDKWDDDKSRWRRAHDLESGVANTFNAEVFIGWTPARGNTSGGIHNLIRHHEQLGGTTYTIRGSIIIGFASVFAQGAHSTGGAYSPPTRNFGYDQHLNSLDNQPPGAPEYTVSATREWSNE